MRRRSPNVGWKHGTSTTGTEREAIPMADTYREQRRRMVDRLRGRIDDERVLEAVGAVPREEFVPGGSPAAYEDRPLPIGSGQTISAPDIVAMMAEALRLTGTENVLEVGGGAGYAAAVLSRLGGHVLTLERHGSLAGHARRTLERLGYDNVEVHHADGTDGARDRAPFDAISVAAMTGDIPPALAGQLAPDGTLVCPVGTERGGELIRLRHERREPLGAVVFVPLIAGTER